jgi:solute carrier family 8 (sodium/calcium exchanger)
MFVIYQEPGEIEFSQPVYVVKESIGTFEVTVERKNGADGQVSIAFKTSDINAIAERDYLSRQDLFMPRLKNQIN